MVNGNPVLEVIGTTSKILLVKHEGLNVRYWELNWLEKCYDLVGFTGTIKYILKTE